MLSGWMPPSNFKRIYAQFDTPRIVYGGIDDFVSASKIEPAIHSVDLGYDYLDILFAPQPEADSLLVLFNGGLQEKVRKDIIFPVFSGQSLKTQINCHFLCISDPTLHYDAEITIGWYLGRPKPNLAELCKQVIQKVSAVTGAKKTVLTGFSAGGFAALNVGQMLPGTLAVPLNPQTDVARYYEFHRNRFARASFGVGSFTEIPQADRERMRFNLIDVYKNGFENFVLYLQNGSDAHHLRHHTLPFLRALGVPCEVNGPQLAGQVFFGDRVACYVSGDGDAWAKGHVGPDRSVLVLLLQEICERGLSVADLVSPEFESSIRAVNRCPS